MKNNTIHPNLVLGLVTFLTLIFSVVFRASQLNSVGNILFIATLVLGFIHWIWAIINVLKHYRTNKGKEDRTIFWVIFVIIVPPVGGIVYYAFNRNLMIQ